MALLIIEVAGIVIDPADYVGGIIAESQRFVERDAAKEFRQDARRKIREQFGLVNLPKGATIEVHWFDENKVNLADLYAAIDQQAAAGLFCDAIDYPAFITMQAGKYARPTPAFLPRSTITEDEVERQRLWSEWIDANHEHRVYDEDGQPTKYLVPTNSRTGNRDIAVSMLRELDETESYVVKRMKAWPAGGGGEV